VNLGNKKMEPIREPNDVDFYVDPRPLTKVEEKMISDYIVADKQKKGNKAEIKKNEFNPINKYCMTLHYAFTVIRPGNPAIGHLM